MAIVLIKKNTSTSTEKYRYLEHPGKKNCVGREILYNGGRVLVLNLADPGSILGTTHTAYHCWNCVHVKPSLTVL